jgi:hypothetical protein
LTLESKAGDDIIVSFMVEIADLDYPNQFFDELLPSSWPTHEEDEEVPLENLDINEIEDGGAVEQFH